MEPINNHISISFFWLNCQQLLIQIDSKKAYFNRIINRLHWLERQGFTLRKIGFTINHTCWSFKRFWVSMSCLTAIFPILCPISVKYHRIHIRISQWATSPTSFSVDHWKLSFWIYSLPSTWVDVFGFVFCSTC